MHARLVYTITDMQVEYAMSYIVKMHRCTRRDNIRKTERKEMGKGSGTKADKNLIESERKLDSTYILESWPFL